MSHQNPIQQAFTRFAADAELTKKAGSWYSHTDEVTSITNLQKSQFDEVYYVNQGFGFTPWEKSSSRRYNAPTSWVV